MSHLAQGVRECTSSQRFLEGQAYDCYHYHCCCCALPECARTRGAQPSSMRHALGRPTEGDLLCRFADALCPQYSVGVVRPRGVDKSISHWV